jgi:hypothetical protein
MNLFAEFRKLLPSDPLTVCIVAEELADGTTRVTTLTGQPLRVRGVNGRSVGERVFVQGGRIIDDAPQLSASIFEI